jgi:hypothetical protein
MEFCQGRVDGWFLVGVCDDEEEDNRAFSLDIACELIEDTPQKDAVQEIRQNKEL